MWARSVIRSNRALHRRVLGNTCVHSENGKFEVMISVARSAGSPQSLVRALVVVALYQDRSSHIAFKTRAFSKSNLARPNICLLIYLSLFTCPSV
jgi:hypothetical protein